ncbi:MAG: TMEM43 family protein [Methylococcales bacterium]|nr:TMEM43 family protein [Methylococcales bacterium]
MSNDFFSRMTTENRSGGLGGSIKGILLGIFLFIVSFPLLWWNEGRSVELYNSLVEGQKLVISVSSQTIKPANNGQLVHTQGLAMTEEVLQDEPFNVFATAIKLSRHVTMYQWQENKTTETTEKRGGSRETKITYTYSQEWHDTYIDSKKFNNTEYHNPPIIYPNKTLQATQVKLGAYQLNTQQIKKINQKIPLSLHNSHPPALLANKKLTLVGNELYLGFDTNNPEIGDMRINFQVVNATTISLIAQQQDNHFLAYQTEAGSPIDLLKLGLMDATALFNAEHRENTVITWAVRFGGAFIMWWGLVIIFKPAAVLGRIIPILGDLISMGTKVFAFLITLPCAMLTIALAWVAYRPLLAMGLITIAVLAIIAIKLISDKKFRGISTQ